jgi:hypothetical protein
MKTKTLFLAIAAGMAWLGVAAADPTNAPVAASMYGPVSVVETPKIHVQTLFSPALPTQSDQIHRYGNISSRPWAQTVGWNAGVPSWREDEDDNMPGSGLSLFWIGHEPE